MHDTNRKAAEQHELAAPARLLLSSVFGPYAQDDDFGSRAINPMELYHNQVTRMQNEFSIRMFHRSWGLMMIQQNIQAPSTLLDFPTREQFTAELKSRHYDIIGISSIIVNVGKVREMCRMVRELSPDSILIVGGHVAAIPGIEHMIDADHIVKGEGISWMRRFLGEDPARPIQHPDIVSGFGHKIMGLKLPPMFRSPAVALFDRGNSPPAILLRESYRLDGEVKSRTIANISHLPAHQIEALRLALKESQVADSKTP